MDENFERVLMLYLLSNKEFFNKTFGILKSEYFTSVERRDVFNIAKKHYAEYHEPVNFATVGVSVKNEQSAERRNSIAKELIEIRKAELPDNMDFMCDETLKWVKDAMYLQALEIGSEGLMKKSDELKRKAEKILDERAKVSIDSDVGIEFHDASSIIDYYGKQLVGVMTQHQCVNTRLGPGFLPGTLSIILAASGVGKSLLMTDLITGMIKQNLNVLLVSLEMSKEEVMKRVHANALDMPIEDFVAEKFESDAFISRLKNAKTGLFYAKDFPAQSFSALQLENLVETFRNEKNVEFDIIFVDYLGIMKSDLIHPNAGLYSYVKSIAEELRASAKRLNLPIITASQLSRASTNSTDSDNSAVSDSYGTVMTADFMMFLLQTEDMKRKGDVICKITKNRFSGKTDTFMMKVDYRHMRFVGAEVPMTYTASTSFAKEMEKNEAFAKREIRKIEHNDIKAAIAIDNKSNNRRNDELDDILNGLL